MSKTDFAKFLKVFIKSRNLDISQKELHIRNLQIKCFKANIYRVSQKNFLESGEQYIVVSSLSFVSPGCLTRLVINGARIFLFKFTINWQVGVQ